MKTFEQFEIILIIKDIFINLDISITNAWIILLIVMFTIMLIKKLIIDKFLSLLIISLICITVDEEYKKKEVYISEYVKNKVKGFFFILIIVFSILLFIIGINIKVIIELYNAIFCIIKEFNNDIISLDIGGLLIVLTVTIGIITIVYYLNIIIRFNLLSLISIVILYLIFLKILLHDLALSYVLTNTLETNIENVNKLIENSNNLNMVKHINIIEKTDENISENNYYEPTEMEKSAGKIILIISAIALGVLLLHNFGVLPSVIDFCRDYYDYFYGELVIRYNYREIRNAILKMDNIKFYNLINGGKPLSDREFIRRLILLRKYVNSDPHGTLVNKKFILGFINDLIKLVKREG